MYSDQYFCVCEPGRRWLELINDPYAPFLCDFEMTRARKWDRDSECKYNIRWVSFFAFRINTVGGGGRRERGGIYTLILRHVFSLHGRNKCVFIFTFLGNWFVDLNIDLNIYDKLYRRVGPLKEFGKARISLREKWYDKVHKSVWHSVVERGLAHSQDRLNFHAADTTGCSRWCQRSRESGCCWVVS